MAVYYENDGSISSDSNLVQPTSTAASDPSAARLNSSGIGQTAKGLLDSVFNFFSSSNGTVLPIEQDWRLRISMAPQTASLFYSNPANKIMSPLIATNGVIFPYTPSVTVTHLARYSSTQLTHSNYNSYFYEGSEVQALNINGDFSVQNIQEGQYLMAAIHFFRSITKMFFGKSPLAGTPPPVVYVDAYGSSYLPHVPCVLTSFTHTMPNDVDYIKVPVGVNLSSAGSSSLGLNKIGQLTRMPAFSTVNLSLQPVYSKNNIANNFSMEKFASGQLLQNGFI